MLGNYNRVALDIGDDVINIAEGSFKNKTIKIHKLFSINTPEGLVEDSKIKDVDELAKYIKKELKKSGVRGSYAQIALKYSKTIMKNVWVPVVNVKELDDILKLVLFEEMTLDIEKFDMEYKIMEKKMKDDQLQYRIKIYILPKGMALTYFEMVKKIGLRPLSLNPQTNNIINLFNGKYKINGESIDFDGTYCVIDLDNESMNLMIINRKEVVYHRNVPYSEADADLEIAKQMGIYLDDAEAIRKEYEKAKMENPKEDLSRILGIEQDVVFEIEEILEGYTKNIAKEISDIMNIYLRTNIGHEIGTILTHGDIDTIEEITDCLKEISGKDCAVIETIEGIKGKKTEALRKYVNAIATIGIR